MNKSEKIVFDLSDLMKAFDDMFAGANPEPVEQSTESDIVSKYKKLYEASVKLENLKKQRADTVKYIDRYNEILESIDSKIDELNKLFSN